MKPVSFDEQAVPVSPPKSVVPGLEDEAGPTEEPSEDTEAESGSEAATLPEPNEAPAPAAAAEGEKPLAPATPADQTTPGPREAPAPQTPKPKAQDDLFEPASSAAPGPSPTLTQWRSRRRTAAAAPRPQLSGVDGARLATNAEPVAAQVITAGAVNEPAEVDVEIPRAKPIRVAAPLKR